MLVSALLPVAVLGLKLLLWACEPKTGPCVCGCGRIERVGWDGYHGWDGKDVAPPVQLDDSLVTWQQVADTLPTHIMAELR